MWILLILLALLLNWSRLAPPVRWVLAVVVVGLSLWFVAVVVIDAMARVILPRRLLPEGRLRRVLVGVQLKAIREASTDEAITKHFASRYGEIRGAALERLPIRTHARLAPETLRALAALAAADQQLSAKAFDTICKHGRPDDFDDSVFELLSTAPKARKLPYHIQEAIEKRRRARCSHRWNRGRCEVCGLSVSMPDPEREKALAQWEIQRQVEEQAARQRRCTHNWQTIAEGPSSRLLKCSDCGLTEEYY